MAGDPVEPIAALGLVNAHASVISGLSAALAQQALMQLATVNPYDAAAVASAAAYVASLSATAQQAATGAAGQTAVLSVVASGGAPVSVPGIPVPKIRNGADPVDVWSRPAKLVRRKRSEGMSQESARALALRLVEVLADTDVRLAERMAMRETLEALGISRYRRVAHPEQSAGGSCGLCLAATVQRYKIPDLLPIHARCKCTVWPIVGGVDIGNSMNSLDLPDLYKDAGDTRAPALKRTRYQVREHGEYGPVLVRPGDHFTGPEEIATA